MLDAQDVTVSYGSTVALEGVSLAVAPGELVGLVGPNGAGKSTFAQAIVGLVKPDRGSVHVAGHDVHRDRVAASPHIGFAPQDIGVYLTESVLANLRFFGRCYGLRGRELDSRIESTSLALGLGDLLERRASQLSGGQRRRVHVAAALLHRPKLVLLDEPTAGMDIDSREALLDVVKSLAADGTAIIYSTHYLREVEQLGSRVVILVDGEVLIDGTAAGLIREHGPSLVELTFAGVPPKVTVPRATVTYDESTVCVTALNERNLAAMALGSLGEAVADLRSVNVESPSLETVYLRLRNERIVDEPLEDSTA